MADVEESSFLFFPSMAGQDQNLLTISRGITLLRQPSPPAMTSPSLPRPFPTHWGLKDASSEALLQGTIFCQLPFKHK